jgi:hypothetical protein
MLIRRVVVAIIILIILHKQMYPFVLLLQIKKGIVILKINDICVLILIIIMTKLILVNH